MLSRQHVALGLFSLACATEACSLLVDTSGLAGGQPGTGDASTSDDATLAGDAATTPPSNDGSLEGGVDAASTPPSNDGSLEGGVDAGRVQFAADAATTLASNQGTPRSIAVDATRIYWTDESGGNVNAIRKDGTGAVQSMATAQSAPFDVGVNAAGVYREEGDAAVDADAGGNCLAMHVDLDGTNLGCVARKPKTSVTHMSLSALGLLLFVQPSSPPGNLALLSTNGAYEDLPVSGSNAPACQASSSMGIASNGAYAFCNDFLAPGAAAFHSYSFATQGDVFLERFGNDDVTAIATDSANVYAAAAGGSIQRLANGANTFELLATAGAPAARMAVDAHYIYWTDSAAGTIYYASKVPVDGGAPIVLASGQAGPFAITTDGQGVYWTNVGDGSIVGAPTPR